MSKSDCVDPGDVVTELVSDRHPQTREMLRWLDCSHLPEFLRPAWEPIYVTALELVAALRDGSELSAALRKLLEAKDCCVRQLIKDRELAEKELSLD